VSFLAKYSLRGTPLDMIYFVLLLTTELGVLVIARVPVINVLVLSNLCKIATIMSLLNN